MAITHNVDVSIVMPVYNSSRWLEESVKSVQGQTHDGWELLIVDDCSTDESMEIASRLEQHDHRIRVIQLSENSGPAKARNKAIEMAKGNYIAFLDSDDLWQPEKLEAQLRFMKKSSIAFSYTAYEKIDEHGKRIGRVGVRDRLSYSDLLKTCEIGCLTAMYNTQMIGKVYMPMGTKREDYATWLSILRNKIDYAYGTNSVLAQYRVYTEQSSAKKIQMAKENWRLYRDIEKLSLLKATYCFGNYAIRGVFRSKYPGWARFFGWLS